MLGGVKLRKKNMRFDGPKEPQESSGGSLEGPRELGWSQLGPKRVQNGSKRGARGRSIFDVFLILAGEFPSKLKGAFLVIHDIDYFIWFYV